MVILIKGIILQLSLHSLTPSGLGRTSLGRVATMRKATPKKEVSETKLVAATVLVRYMNWRLQWFVSLRDNASEPFNT